MNIINNNINKLVIIKILILISFNNYIYTSSKSQLEKSLVDLLFRSYKNVNSQETKQILKSIKDDGSVSMSKESWNDLILDGFTKFENNSDWKSVVKAILEKVDPNDLVSRRAFIHTLDDLENKNIDASNELRDYLREAKLIDIIK